MTVPGNDTLLITLLATFTACGGYAAGRLHQWYRTGLDRDEAYRDGYDTATRSVFGLAARLIGPKRAVRGTAVVKSAPPVVRLPPPPVVPPPVGLRPSAFAAAEERSVAAMSAGVLSAADAGDSPPLGAPVLAESSSSGRDRSSSAAEDGSASSSAAEDGSPRAWTSSAAEDGSADGDGAGGRHLVPDELVRAPTYRLPPDRVARAKVRQAVPVDDEAQETTRPPSVPRPRSS